MSESLTVYQRVKDFVNKYNNDGLDFLKSPNGEQQAILTSLASAVNGFEIQENERDKRHDLQKMGLKEFDSYYTENVLQNNFDVALSNLNRWMKIAKAHNLYTDSKLKKEIEEFNTTRSKIEGENENLRIPNGKLSKENIRFREGLIKAFADFPEAEAKYGWLLENPKTEESKID